MRARTTTGFRRAVWGSLALHALGACALLILLRPGERMPAMAGIDTRAVHDPQVRMSLDREVLVEVAPPAKLPPADDRARPDPAPPQVEPVEPTRTAAAAQFPAVRGVPHALPPELVARIRKSGGGANAAVDPDVRPAGGSTTAPAIHGAFNPGQTVVYVLDCSGSMGAAGKFDAARDALVATLRQQPAAVRFQVIVYSGGAKPLLVSDRAAVPATEANVRAAAAQLAALDPRGTSNHIEGVRAALAFRPDVVLILTDADDLNAADLKRMLAAAPRPASACVGLVAPDGVRPPRLLK